MSTFLRKLGQPLLRLLAALIFSLAARADSTVVFNEIMYHPASNEPGLEWIELHNQMAVNMDLSGWSVEGGIQFRFSEGTVLPGGGYLVLAISPATLATATGLTNVYGPFQGRLANSGEPLELRNNNHRLMDAVDYGVEGDWPVGPDGSGVSLAKINPNSASAPAWNWRASVQIAGTPGKANFPPPSSSVTKSILVSMETAWKYKDDSPDLGTGWRAADFDDDPWPSGRALFYAGNIPAPAGEPQTIGTLFSTGLDGQGDPIGPGDPDPHYQLIVSAQGSPPPPPAAATVIESHPAWAANDSFSGWIGPVNPGTVNVAAGSYHYRTFFNLTGFDSSRAEITLSVAVDNTLNSVLLNGAGTGLAFSGFNAFSSPFILRNGFVPGTNSLEFRTVNEGGSPNPAGFRARLSGLAPVPLPKSTALGLGRNTCYFRTTFQFAGNPFATRLSLRPLADDGAVIYLNGAEVLRLNMPGGSIAASTPAATNVTAPAFSGPVAIPSTSLMTGANVLAVEVHQATGGADDLLFAAELTAETSLSGPPALAFNEIAASSEAVFWLELINYGTNTLALGGCVLASAGSVDGEYVFPQTQSFAPGACLVLTQSQLGFRPKSGDRLFLYPAGRNSVLDAVVVKKSLRGRAPDGTGPWLYPAQGTPGAPNLFAFHDEIVINEIMYHHRPVPAAAAVFGESTLVPITAGWKYDQSRANLRTDWRAPEYDDRNWPEGMGLFYVEDAALPAPKNTPLALGATTYYFRTQFLFSGSTNHLELSLYPVIDDGAVFYLNGQEIYRLNMATGEIGFAMLATPGVADAAYSGPFIVPATNLVAGTNLLAAEVHQSSPASSDVVFGTELLARVELSPATPYGESAESWVELYNRSTNTVDLTGWELDKGIDFTFPGGTTMAPRSYLVVAKDAEYLRRLYPSIAITGNFTNRLSRHSDLIVLQDAAKNPVDEVRYYDAGHWPSDADGGGSSLELRDPRADNAQAEAWAASNEARRSQWMAYTYRGVATAETSPSPTLWKEFVFGLLEAGEALLDDISVVESPDGAAKELLQNGSFENGPAAWRFLGTHERCAVIVDPDNPGNHVLHLVATGPTEHMHNHVETTLAGGAGIVNGRHYRISFRAKWLAGSNQLHTRLYFNRLPKWTLLSVPEFNGTPGARNSMFAGNIGPTFHGLRHTPVIPQANEPVAVSIFADDPDGVRTCLLWWSANGGNWNNVLMTMQGDGRFRATLPGLAAATLVQFYVEATDGMGAKAAFPAAGRNSRAFIQVQDGQANLAKLHNLRILMTAAEAERLHAATNVMSNAFKGATVVYDEAEVFYDVGVHLQGSERGRLADSRVGFTIEFQPDHLFRGVHDSVSIDPSGGHSGLGGRQDEIVLKHAINHAGALPGMYDDLVRVIAPRRQNTTTALLIMAKYGDEFLDSQYRNGSDGTAFKLELIYYPLQTSDGNPQSPKLPQPDDVLGTDIRDLGPDQEQYRWNLLIENNRRRDDYSQIIALAKAFSLSGSALDAQSRQLLDVNEWMRAFAVKALTGDVDTYDAGLPHNLIIYFRPEDQKALVFLWDMDFSWTRSTTSPLYGGANVSKIINLPANRRLFYGHLDDIMTTTFNAAYLAPWTTHYGSLVGQNYTGVLNYINQRAAFARRQLPAQVPFAITTNNGKDFLTNTSTATITGSAWINIKEITLAGQPGTFAVNWTGLNSWQATVPLILGTNWLQFFAYDFQGQLVASNRLLVTSTATGGGEDTDQDGLPDVWELANGLNPGLAEANFDFDGDGLSNLQEYLSGTHPWDGQSCLKLEAAIAPGSGLQLRFLAAPGRSYSLQSTDDLSRGAWQSLSNFSAQAAERVGEATDASPPASGARFYRLVTPQLP